MIEINGIKLDADFMDADFVGLYEDAVHHLQEKAVAFKSKKYDGLKEAYLDQIATVDEYFDEIFGEGTAVQVFQGKEKNLMAHLQAVETMTNWGNAEKKKLNDFTNKYTQRQAAQAQRQKAQMSNFVSNKKN